MMRVVLIIAMALAVVAGEAEAATQQGTVALARWKIMDVCTRQAQAAYRDLTAELNAKRDAQLNACLNANNLPPRQPEAQPNPR